MTVTSQNIDEVPGFKMYNNLKLKLKELSTGTNIDKAKLYKTIIELIIRFPRLRNFSNVN